MAEEVVVQTVAKDRELNVRVILGVIVALALALFVLQNTDDVPVSFLWMDWTLPLFLLLLITVVLTAVLTLVVSWFLGRRR